MKKNQFNFTIGLLSVCLLLFTACKKSDDAAKPSGGGGTVLPPPAKATSVMINGYFPNYSYTSTGYSSADYSNLTIAYYFSVTATSTGNLVTGGAGEETKMAAMISAAHAVGTKAYLCFGGAGSYGSQVYYDMAINDVSRKEFARQVKAFCLNKGFDGFDVDWEGLRSTQDGVAHEALLTSLKDSLHSVGLGLVATVQQGGSASFFTSNGMNQADLVQIMSYDATGTWNSSPYGQHSSYTFASDGISYWNTTKGIAKSKLVLGVPFYGYQFNTSNACPCNAVRYKDIVANYPSLTDDVDFLNSGVYANTYFNGYQTLVDKINLTYSSAMPGIMIWEITQDASGSSSLLTRMKNFLVANNLSVKKLANSIP